MSDSDEVIENYIRDLLKDNRTWEELLVAGADAHAEVMAALLPVVCVHPSHKRQFLEFEDRTLNALYLAIKRWYSMTLTMGKPYVQVPMTVLDGLLRALCRSPDPCGVSESGVQAALNRMAVLRMRYRGQSLETPVLTAWESWVGRRRLASSITAVGQADFWLPKDMYEVMINVQDSMPRRRNRQLSFAMNELYIPKENMKKKLKTGIAELDKITRGGFARGTSAYCLAASGAGKTVAAVQVGSAMAITNDAVGSLITTEQPAYQMFPRVVTSVTGYRLRDELQLGIVREILNAEEKEKVELTEKLLAPKLRIVDWLKKGPETTFEQDLMAIIRQERKAFGGRLDFVVFDWLGASLNNKVGNNADKLRGLYKMASDAMNDIAVAEDIFILYFGQADPTKNSKKHIGPEDARECKDLHFNATYAWGISALLDTSDNKKTARGHEDMSTTPPAATADAPKAKDVYARDQWWNFFKVRQGVARCIPVRRRFDQQQFEFVSDNIVSK
jgi:hypothetical protein